MRASYLEPPAGWRRSQPRGAGPFVTAELFIDAEGRRMRWESRAHRKGGFDARRRGRWMSALFSIGSVCFFAGGGASQLGIGSLTAQGSVFFGGSLAFTAAAYLQFAEAVNARRTPRPEPGRKSPGESGPRWRPASWEPRRIDWLATLVQLAGTILFNLSTLSALDHDLSATQANVRVWAPDLVGSIAFLVSSELALAEVCHRWVCLRRRTLPWWIVALNLVGSVAFGLSAIASLVRPGSGMPVSAQISDAGTWFGAACFLAGALLLVPEAGQSGRRVSGSANAAR